MKRRTIAIACSFGRFSGIAIGLGLLAIGFGEAIYALRLCASSERED
jgi:hypothetical protein